MHPRIADGGLIIEVRYALPHVVAPRECDGYGPVAGITPTVGCLVRTNLIPGNGNRSGGRERGERGAGGKGSGERGERGGGGGEGGEGGEGNIPASGCKHSWENKMRF